jgi:hypothetical protein
MCNKFKNPNLSSKDFCCGSGSFSGRQDRYVVEYARGTNSTAIPDHELTPNTAEVVESLLVVTKSQVVSIQSREPKDPRKVSVKATSSPNRKGTFNQKQDLETKQCPKQEA